MGIILARQIGLVDGEIADGLMKKIQIVVTDECDPNPCLYGGACTDGDDAFTCVCPGGFSGNICEERPASLCVVDSCGEDAGDGKCFDLATSSAKACACKPGYTSGEFNNLYELYLEILRCPCIVFYPKMLHCVCVCNTPVSGKSEC